MLLVQADAKKRRKQAGKRSVANTSVSTADEATPSAADPVPDKDGADTEVRPISL